jgi:hypothetical protein
MKLPNEPLPGANYMSDTKNYPWHRPADIESYDVAVKHVLDRLKTPSGASLVYSMLKMDMPISAITSAMLLQSISKGRMQIDMGIVVAGPVARGIEVFAKSNSLAYEMGADANDEIIYTPTQLALIMGPSEEKRPPSEEAMPVEEDAAPEMGLMSLDPSLVEAAPDDEQQGMLGMAEEDPINGMA